MSLAIYLLSLALQKKSDKLFFYSMCCASLSCFSNFGFVFFFVAFVFTAFSILGIKDLKNKIKKIYFPLCLVIFLATLVVTALAFRFIMRCSNDVMGAGSEQTCDTGGGLLYAYHINASNYILNAIVLSVFILTAVYSFLKNRNNKQKTKKPKKLFRMAIVL